MQMNAKSKVRGAKAKQSNLSGLLSISETGDETGADLSQLFSLISAANFLALEPLLDAATSVLAGIIHSCVRAAGEAPRNNYNNAFGGPTPASMIGFGGAPAAPMSLDKLRERFGVDVDLTEDEQRGAAEEPIFTSPGVQSRRSARLPRSSLTFSRDVPIFTPPGTPISAPKRNESEALGYIGKVKSIFADEPDTFETFNETIRNFNEQSIDTLECITTLIELLDGRADLIRGLNAFLVRAVPVPPCARRVPPSPFLSRLRHVGATCPRGWRALGNLKLSVRF